MARQDLIEERIMPFLKKTLSNERMAHVAGMMDLSEKLASRHGFDPCRARLAGALHDIAYGLAASLSATPGRTA
jgi:HD superfamily phosphohydrolase YqeK